MKFNLSSVILNITVIIAFVSFANSATQAEQLNSSNSAKTKVAQINLPTSELINVLKSGGYILYMRHGMTNHEQKDNTQDFTDCTKQRNLSRSGREQLKKIAQTIQTLKIPIGEVLSSPYCRAKETANIVFGKFTIEPKLQFSISKNRQESQSLGEQLKQMMHQASTEKYNAVFVGHTSNLRDGLGVWPKPEGVIAVFQKQQDKLYLRGLIKPNDWPN
ncbi:MAG: histidine phosphatase family protein [Colwellia sp.]|nr:histidine phosphatase family protein [Colwellia sp.]